MRAVVFAYHDIGCVGIEALLAHGYEIAAVFTHRDDPAENTWFRSVAVEATAHDLPVYAPDDVNHPMWVERIRRLEPDVVFSFYYRNLIGTEILDLPPRGCFNLHGSLLPRYRGRAPINWVLVHGETQTGVTLHHMTARPDDGDVVGQRAIPIDDDDTALTLHRKAAAAAGELLDELLPRIAAGSAPRTPQDPSRGELLRRPQAGRRRHRLAAQRTRDPQPGARRDPALPRRLQPRRTAQGAVLVGRRGAAGRAAGRAPAAPPGTVLSVDPFLVATGDGALRVEAGQSEGGVYTTGGRLAAELALVTGMRFGAPANVVAEAQRKQRVLILGVNGFIGNHLGERLLDSGRYEVFGMDLSSSSIQRLLPHPDFHFAEGDISIHREWIEYHVSKCDVVLPLVAIATPIEYVRNPLGVFELDFEENLRVVRYCARYGKRLIFPSTSEVYGMSEDAEFDEDKSNLVLGPIRKQRWIYSCCKQLLDRVIWASGSRRGCASPSSGPSTGSARASTRWPRRASAARGRSPSSSST